MEYISLSILNFWTNFKLLFEGEINIYLIEVTRFEATLSDRSGVEVVSRVFGVGPALSLLSCNTLDDSCHISEPLSSK